MTCTTTLYSSRTPSSHCLLLVRIMILSTPPLPSVVTFPSVQLSLALSFSTSGCSPLTHIFNIHCVSLLITDDKCNDLSDLNVILRNMRWKLHGILNRFSFILEKFLYQGKWEIQTLLRVNCVLCLYTNSIAYDALLLLWWFHRSACMQIFVKFRWSILEERYGSQRQVA